MGYYLSCRDIETSQLICSSRSIDWFLHDIDFGVEYVNHESICKILLNYAEPKATPVYSESVFLGRTKVSSLLFFKDGS